MEGPLNSARSIGQEPLDPPEFNLGPSPRAAALSTRRPAESLTMRSDRTGLTGRHRRESGRCSRQHVRRGGENRRRGAGVCGGCQTAAPASVRFPPPDSGVVPFSETQASPFKSDPNASGRVGTPFGSIVTLPSSPVLKFTASLRTPRFNLGEKRVLQRPCLRD